MSSERDKARRAAHLLKKQAGWGTDGYKAPDPMEKLRALDSKLRGDEAYEQSETCSDCLAARDSTNDDTALCEKHLSEAMGF